MKDIRKLSIINDQEDRQALLIRAAELLDVTPVVDNSFLTLCDFIREHKLKAEMDMSVENQTITVFVPVNIPLDQADKDKIDTAMDVPIDAVVKDSKKPKKVKVEFDEPEVSNEDDPF